MLWNFVGAASVLPVYFHLYLQRSTKRVAVPTNQAQALPFTAFINLLLSLPLLIPPALGATPFQIQDAVVIWFFGPLALVAFQDLVSYFFSSVSCKGIANPVKAAYWIVGAASGIVHIGITLWTFLSPDVTWSRIYWPQHKLVTPGPAYITEGAMIFTKYDPVIIYLAVFSLGAYMVGPESPSASTSSTKRRHAVHPILTLTIISGIFGPGAGISWLLARNEGKINAPAVLSTAQ